MLHHSQYLSSIAANQRPLQQSSSPSDDNSVSTATPPHHISRASPASTALVISSNNIASNQPNSRQLTPSNGSATSSGSNNNQTSSSAGTGSSLGGGGGGNSHHNHNHHHAHNHHQQANMNGTNGNCVAPNPMARQFACHTKSMSAGVVVPVPGISNNLATATGMNQNNIINDTMANQHHQPTTQHQQTHHRQSNMSQINQHQLAQSHKQQREHHHRSSSNHNYQQQQQQQQHQQQQQQQQHQQQHQHQQQQHLQQVSHHRSISSHQHQQINNQHQNNQHVSDGGGGQAFLDARQATSSSIILNNNNINNIHNRSHSTHLSNVILNPQVNVGANPSHQRHHFPHQMNNSFWSIDEKISKSQGKLTASGYLPQMFNPSITDISCDNISAASRLMASAGNCADAVSATSGHAPGYYLPQQHGGAANHAHHSNAHPSTGGASTRGAKAPEFLPICDLLFNLISMIIYFCENVFGIIALIALYYHATSKYWALIGASFVFASNFLCQYLSLRWLYKMKLEVCKQKREAQEELEDEEECERRYYNRMAANMRNYQCGSCTWLPDGATEVQLKFLLSIALDAIMHIFCLGFLVRYIKLVIPVNDTSRVKREARDLCMLRMIHGFVQSAPLLLLQSYMVCSQNYSSSVVNLSTTSVILSLINVCWALASFTKYARKKYMHKFVLSWLGILSQLLWRLGTISSRVAALTIYAVYYNYWMLIVLSLHWVTMFLWLIKPGNLLKDEVNLSRSKKFSLAVGAAWIYCFCYMNFEEQNSRAKMGIFYLIMFLENNLLFTVCQTLSAQVTWFKSLSILVVYLGFVFGMLFMFLYYKYFHVTVLNNGLSCSQESIDSIADQLSPAGKKIAGFKPGTLRLRSEDSMTTGRRYNGNINATLTGSHPEITRNTKPPYLTSNHAPMPRPSVFGCKPSQNENKK